MLFYTDATATLGGNTLKTDEWGLDAVTAGLQKCMAGSAGTSPVTLSPAFVDTCRRRQHVEEGVRDAHHVTGPDPVIGSNYFDICMLMDYWGPNASITTPRLPLPFTAPANAPAYSARKALTGPSPDTGCTATLCWPASRPWGSNPLVTSATR